MKIHLYISTRHNKHNNSNKIKIKLHTKRIQFAHSKKKAITTFAVNNVITVHCKYKFFGITYN